MTNETAGSGALDLAIRANEAGICVLPPKQDGSKRPDAVSWTKYQTQRTTEEQIRSAYRGSRTGLGFVCGAISGGLELFDFDERSAYKEFKSRATDAGLAELVARIESGYRENTPNGVHLFYRCTETECKKLAQRHNEDGTVKALIETKGEGGYAVVAPSNGRVHPTGRPYILLSGGPESIVTITTAEREELHRIARSLDQSPQRQDRPLVQPVDSSAEGRLRPGDDFNARASWGEVLEGWTHVFERDGVSNWRRPGKANGISATVNHGGTDRLACFSTSTAFEDVAGSKTTYDKFGAFAALHHEGDLTAAARDLAGKGYGRKYEDQGTSVASDAFVALEHNAPSWPDPLGEAAYHGLAGEFVRLIEPHTEADPAALMFQFLAQFGNVIGRIAHFLAEADKHFLNLFVVLVGQTAKGRKGTSQGQVQARFRCVDESWAADRVMSGLSSGEGLIWQLRDPIEKREPIKQKGMVTGYQNVIVDDGIKDKRLLIIEPEFASTLRVIGRDGNTLSAVIRQMWDTGNLRTLTKNSPAKATDAHGSIIGHITRDELRRYLTSTEAGNGFANRFQWVCVRRSKVLPEGGRLGEVNFAPFAQRLNDAVRFAKQAGELRRDRKARELWFDVYEGLSEGRPGLLGAVTSRAEAQVMRLACIHAALDCSDEIQKPHLEAALELWRYAADSARFIFGDDLGDPVSDEILRALRGAPDGLTRTQIRDLFGRHRSGQTSRGLGNLLELGLAHSESDETGGRPAERWFARTGSATKATEATKGSRNQSEAQFVGTSVASVAVGDAFESGSL